MGGSPVSYAKEIDAYDEVVKDGKLVIRLFYLTAL